MSEVDAPVCVSVYDKPSVGGCWVRNSDQCHYRLICHLTPDLYILIRGDGAQISLTNAELRSQMRPT